MVESLVHHYYGRLQALMGDENIFHNSIQKFSQSAIVLLVKFNWYT